MLQERILLQSADRNNWSSGSALAGAGGSRYNWTLQLAAQMKKKESWMDLLLRGANKASDRNRQGKVDIQTLL